MKRTLAALLALAMALTLIPTAALALDPFTTPSGVTLTTTGISWNAVTDAAGYLVSLTGPSGGFSNESVSGTSKTFAELTVPGDYRASVVAVPTDTATYENSAPGTDTLNIPDPTPPTPSTPTDLPAPAPSWNGRVLSWADVTGAASYNVTLSGGDLSSNVPKSGATSPVTFSESEMPASANEYTATVEAVPADSTLHNPSTGRARTTIAPTGGGGGPTRGALTAPTNVTWGGTAGRTLTWGAVTGAGSYSVRLTRPAAAGAEITKTATTASLTFLAADMPVSGSYSAYVKAIPPAGSSDTPSAESSAAQTSYTAPDVYAGSVIIGTPNNWNVYIGEPKTFTATVGPTGVTDPGVTWSMANTSADRGVATIDSSTGTVTATGAGTVTIKATADGSQDPNNPISVTRQLTVGAARSLRSIAITTQPSKRTYGVGESFNPAGLVVSAAYAVGSQWVRENVYANDPDLSFSPSTNLQATDKAVTVTYKTATAPTTIPITVTDPSVLTGVKLDKTTAILPMGSASSLQLTATATPDTATPVTYVWGYSTTNGCASVDGNGVVTPIKPGKETIKVTAQQGSITKTATCVVTVTAPTIVSIGVVSGPTRDTYRLGEAFDPTGLVLDCTDSNGVTNDLPLSSVTYSKKAFDTKGNIQFTITYGAVSVDIPLTIVEASGTLDRIVVETPPRVVYALGETFDKTGMAVRAYYTNPASDLLVDLSKVVATPTQLNTAGAGVSVKLTYTSGGVTKETTQTVAVLDAKPVSMVRAGGNNPAKSQYFAGERFDPTGMGVTVNFAGGSTLGLDLPSNLVTCTPATLAATTTKITFTYRDKDASGNAVTLEQTLAQLGITVDAVTSLDSLTIASMPAKTSYNLNDSFDKTGLTAELVYNGGSTRILTAAQLACTPQNLTTAGTATITATYTTTVAGQQKSVRTTFPVTVSATPGPGPAPGPSTGVATIVNCNSWVNVRSGPSTGYAKIGTAPRGAQYTILGTSGNWYKVQYGNREGWIYGQYISTSGGGGTPATGIATIVNCKSWVNVRSGPSTGYSKLGTAKRNAQYEILGYVTSSAGNRWYKVQYGTKVGWIYGQYISTSGGGGSTPGSGYGYIGNCNSWVNVRSGPSTGYSKLGTANKGAEFLILGTSGNWYKIQYTPTQVGWVYGQYLITGGAVSTRSVYINNPTTVYASASTAGTVLGSAAVGTTYSYLNTSGSWYMIAYGTRIGYVATADAVLN